jgi:proteic killer suppression protein
MIRTKRDKRIDLLLAGSIPKGFPADLARAAVRKLLMLDAAGTVEALRVPPGNRLEALGGDRAGQHSIRINQQWRICFVWRDGDAYDVEIVDYH